MSSMRRRCSRCVQTFLPHYGRSCAGNAAGRPKPTRKHSSFPRWAEIIGGIVEFAGFVCPLDTAEIQSASDVDGEDMRELVKLLGEAAPSVTFDELAKIASEHGLFERIIGPRSKAGKEICFRLDAERYDRRIFPSGPRFVVEGKGHSRRFHVVLEEK